MFEPLAWSIQYQTVHLVVLAYLLCYFICGIPFGLLFSKLFKKDKDLRTSGSGNIGFTNALRVNGKAVGILTLFFDVIKAYISIQLASVLLSDALMLERSDLFSASFIWVLALAFVACIVGHVFSIYLKFKGGKGIAVGLGATLSFIPLTGLLILGVFFIGVISSKKVSVGSISAALAIVPCCLLYSQDIRFVLLCALVTIIVVWAHRSNIKKIMDGTESSISKASHKE